uniref:Auto-transporter adhesin head GIN domain-containing protein n=1 Tax=Graphocephala atropunctata TaxID=36148 RepID=A0A1B6LVQ3_9HEMI
MWLTLLLLVGISFAEADDPYKFRDHCNTRHLNNKYTAECNGQQQNLTLSDLTTKNMVEIKLTNFLSVTFDSSVQIERITVSKTPLVSVSLSNPILIDLRMDSVDELILRYEHSRDTGQRANMSLTNVKTLRLISDLEFVWSIESINLTDVTDLDLGSSMLKILAERVAISNSNIRVNSNTSIVLTAVSAFIDKSSIYIYKKGCINVAVNQFSVKDTRIDLEDGHINLINSNVLIANSLLYGFNNGPISVHGDASVRFEGNSIFTRDIVSILGLSKPNIIFKDNSFGCNDCSVKGSLLVTDLQEIGDVNYCYINCNLTLNAYKAYLMKSCFCNESETYVNHSLLCNSDMNCLKTSTHFSLHWWLLVILILLLLVIVSVICIRHIDKRRRQKTKGLNNGMQTFTYKREQPPAFNNDCYDNIEHFEHHYESGELVSCR